MKLAIWNTSRLITISGVTARLWEGTTDKGVKVHCLITTVAADAGADLAEFDRELAEVQEPSPESDTIFPYAAVVQRPRMRGRS
jgi:hypothetical protein